MGGGRKSFPEKVTVRREKTYGNSRFDLYVESGKRKAFIEVKGVTLEENNIVRFPDAPTERGIKHLCELMHAAADGYEAYLLLVIQMKGVRILNQIGRHIRNLEKHLRRQQMPVFTSWPMTVLSRKIP